jgi:hypothetical protein
MTHSCKIADRWTKGKDYEHDTCKSDGFGWISEESTLKNGLNFRFFVLWLESQHVHWTCWLFFGLPKLKMLARNLHLIAALLNHHIFNIALRQNSPKGAYSWLVNSSRIVAPVEWWRLDSALLPLNFTPIPMTAREKPYRDQIRSSGLGLWLGISFKTSRPTVGETRQYGNRLVPTEAQFLSRWASILLITIGPLVLAMMCTAVSGYSWIQNSVTNLDFVNRAWVLRVSVMHCYARHCK